MILTNLTIILGFLSALGIGVSTVAVANFFVAVWDGHIDEHERKMMGVTYFILRTLMGLLLFSLVTFGIVSFLYDLPFDKYLFQVITLVFVLFINAGFMIFHKIPSAFGPAIQATAWYTLGVISLFHLMGVSFSYLRFLLLYLTFCFLLITIVNFLLIYSKHRYESALKS